MPTFRILYRTFQINKKKRLVYMDINWIENKLANDLLKKTRDRYTGQTKQKQIDDIRLDILALQANYGIFATPAYVANILRNTMDTVLIPELLSYRFYSWQNLLIKANKLIRESFVLDAQKKYNKIDTDDKLDMVYTEPYQISFIDCNKEIYATQLIEVSISEEQIEEPKGIENIISANVISILDIPNKKYNNKIWNRYISSSYDTIRAMMLAEKNKKIYIKDDITELFIRELEL